jgi:flagellar basal body rod protein FlgF
MASIYPVNKFKSNIYPGLSISPASPTTVFSDSDVAGEGYGFVTSIIAANKTATPRNLNLIIEKTGGGTTNSAYLLYNVTVPANTAFEVIQGNKFILKSGDKLKAFTDAEAGTTSGVVDMTVSYVVHIPPTTT